MEIPVYTKEEIDELFRIQNNKIKIQIEMKLKQKEFEKLPRYLSSSTASELLGISQDTLRARKNKKYKYGKHFIKKNGRILWDKNAILNNKEEYEIFQ